jgi:hypothetical protein
VREALQRANFLRPQGHLDDEPHYPSSFLGTHSRLRVEGEWGGAHRDLPPIDPVLVAYPDASYASRSPVVRLHSQGPVPAQPEIWTRFQPGNETASVLQLTKRPRLRPKDVSHRQSLGHSEQGSPSSSGFSGPLVFRHSCPMTLLFSGLLSGPLTCWSSCLALGLHALPLAFVPGSRFYVSSCIFRPKDLSLLDPPALLRIEV